MSVIDNLKKPLMGLCLVCAMALTAQRGHEKIGRIEYRGWSYGSHQYI